MATKKWIYIIRGDYLRTRESGKWTNVSGNGYIEQIGKHQKEYKISITYSNSTVRKSFYIKWRKPA